jgi:hypothetical protein
LSSRQASGRLDDEHPIGGGPKHMQLAIAANVVDPRVGPGIGREHESVVESEGQTVGHSSLLCSRRSVLGNRREKVQTEALRKILGDPLPANTVARFVQWGRERAEPSLAR